MFLVVLFSFLVFAFKFGTATGWNPGHIIKNKVVEQVVETSNLFNVCLVIILFVTKDRTSKTNIL